MAHLYLGISECVVWFCLIFGVLSEWTGNEFLCRKLWVKFISQLYSSLCN